MHWEDLTAADFKDAVARTGGVCVLPIGCLEKHGDHLPLDTDIRIAREIARRAAAIEPFMIFPYYPFGFVAEVRHMSGTVSLDAELQLRILDRTCAEIARNGFTKIVLGNGHGGNNHALRAFAMSQLDRRRDHLLHVIDLWGLSQEQQDRLAATHGRPASQGHADFTETSGILAIAPGLVHLDRVDPAEGRPLHRLEPLERRGVHTAMNWYGSYPHQFAGDPTGANAAYGEDLLACNAANLADAVREIKRQDLPARLLAEFYAAAERPRT